jgi:hypothetical protein
MVVVGRVGWFGVEEMFCECCMSRKVLFESETVSDENEVLYLPTFRSRVFDIAMMCKVC